jgi:hypothetical protein
MYGHRLIARLNVRTGRSEVTTPDSDAPTITACYLGTPIPDSHDDGAATSRVPYIMTTASGHSYCRLIAHRSYLGQSLLAHGGASGMQAVAVMGSMISVIVSSTQPLNSVEVAMSIRMMRGAASCALLHVFAVKPTELCPRDEIQTVPDKQGQDAALGLASHHISHRSLSRFASFPRSTPKPEQGDIDGLDTC